ncbi:hypothetical protein [Listeria newyorkensis]|uniref:hypothetical protein n=1 Tax=Listeria newyorkensis TaxID=1497681 RepID=UPI00051D32D9|nr:hypothetical protein [Listeria newyorkensis]KGL43571.1 hypothetical protein EP58_07475 [Listeria newyorkensis]
MNPVENIMDLEKKMTANGYWYADSKKDLRMLVLAIANQGLIYVEAMDTKKKSLSITTKKGMVLCNLQKAEAPATKKAKVKA